MKQFVVIGDFNALTGPYWIDIQQLAFNVKRYESARPFGWGHVVVRADADYLSSHAGFGFVGGGKKSKLETRPGMARAHDARADDEHCVCLPQLFLDLLVDVLTGVERLLVIKHMNVLTEDVFEHGAQGIGDLPIFVSVAGKYVEFCHKNSEFG